MGKVTLRGIIESVEKANHTTSESFIYHRNFLYSVEADLKQLEKRIEKIIPPSTLKTNCVAVVTRKAMVGMLQDILQDILGKE